MTDTPNFNETYRKSWTGKYKGIHWEIKNWPKQDFKYPDVDGDNIESSFEYVGHNNWAGYIKIYAPQLASEDNILLSEKHMFTEKLFNDKSDKFNVDLNGMNGGCTYHESEYKAMATKNIPFGIDARKVLVTTLGWDYQHSWNEDRRYTVEQVYEDVKETIESLLMEVGPVKVWNSMTCEFEYPVENANV